MRLVYRLPSWARSKVTFPWGLCCRALLPSPSFLSFNLGFASWLHNQFCFRDELAPWELINGEVINIYSQAEDQHWHFTSCERCMRIRVCTVAWKPLEIISSFPMRDFVLKIRYSAHILGKLHWMLSHSKAAGNTAIHVPLLCLFRLILLACSTLWEEKYCATTI